MVMVSPFANSIRQQPMQASQVVTPNQGLGALFQRLGISQPNLRTTRDIPDPVPMNLSQGTENFYAVNLPQQPRPAQLQSANPFEGNEQYQALMDFQQSLAPNQEQQARLQELRSAFEGTGAFKDYRINQLQNQLQQRQRNPMMGMGLGGVRPMGMQPYQVFGRTPMMQQRPMQQPMVTPRGGYAQYNQMNQPRQPMPMPRGGYSQYQQQPYYQGPSMNQGPNELTAMQQQYISPYQQPRPQPQQFGGYGMGQQMGGYGGYGGMQNPYQPQQMGSYNQNNFAGYGQQQPAGMF
jgi:hypothetical protein